MHFSVILAKANGESAHTYSNNNSVKVVKRNAIVNTHGYMAKYELMHLGWNEVKHRFAKGKKIRCQDNNLDNTDYSNCKTSPGVSHLYTAAETIWLAVFLAGIGQNQIKPKLEVQGKV